MWQEQQWCKKSLCEISPHSFFSLKDLISYEIHSQDPDEALVQLWVHSLKVTKLDGLPQELLVEGQGEASINVVPVENSQTHNPPNKVEVRQVVLKKQQRAWQES